MAEANIRGKPHPCHHCLFYFGFQTILIVAYVIFTGFGGILHFN